MLARRHREQPFPARLVLVGDRDLLAARAQRIGGATGYADYSATSFAPVDGRLEVWHQQLAVPVTPGELDPANSHSVLTLLQRAADACATGAFSALVTAPIQKSVLMDAGIPFVGHTEFLADRTHTPRVVMMLVGGAEATPLRVALVTTHLALKDVPAALTPEALDETLAIVDADLRAKFALPTPRIACLRAESACRRRRASGTRGDRRHRTRQSRGHVPRAVTSPDHFPPTRCSCPRSRSASTRSSRCITTRVCRCSRPQASDAAST
jgi:4-hydroxy-L-threonine phosphate dehydrogenase PdxA